VLTPSTCRYYEGRTRQGEEESRFEETALNLLDREANKCALASGRVLGRGSIASIIISDVFCVAVGLCAVVSGSVIRPRLCVSQTVAAC